MKNQKENSPINIIRQEDLQILLDKLKNLENVLLINSNQLINQERYSEEEAAKKLKISKSTLQRIRKSNKISYIKTGAGIQYTKKDLEAYLKENYYIVPSEFE